MLLGAVDCIMLPTAGLLYPDGSPFVFAEEACFGESFCQFFGEDDMSVMMMLFIIIGRE